MVSLHHKKNTLLRSYRRSLNEDMKEMNYCIGKLNQVNREINDLIYEQIRSRRKISNKKTKNDTSSRNVVY